jgi:hypothetical protein
MKWLLALVASLSLLPCAAAAESVARGEQLPLTFIVAGDSHFGAQGMQESNRRLIEHANQMKSRAYPAAIGGEVGELRGMLMMGDMTDWAQQDQWDQFKSLYGLTGKDGLLKMPVFEALGNHDIGAQYLIEGLIKQRHGGLTYAWDWAGIRIICLGLYPGTAERQFLNKELTSLDKRRPIILYFHYAIEGPYSSDWTAEHKEAFGRLINGYNVLAIFHGHYHAPGHYRWRGFDVLRPGAPRHNSDTFMVVRVDGARFAAAWWHWGRGEWMSSPFTKSLALP